MKKHTFPTELAYVIGLILLAFGAAFMERADFGMSMIVAPAYLIHLKLSQTFPWMTFGRAEYLFQALLLIIMCISIRRFRAGYLVAFITALIYGTILDVCISAVAILPIVGFAGRCAAYICGLVLSAVGVACMFHTYIAPEVYELFVKEVSSRYQLPIHRVKTVYDICSCLLSVVMSFLFFGFGNFRGVNAGTILCALVNGRLIGLFSAGLEKRFRFEDMLRRA